MKMVTVAQAAKKMKMSASRFRELAGEGRVKGARRTGEGRRAIWSIPVDEKTGKPTMVDWPLPAGRPPE